MEDRLEVFAFVDYDEMHVENVILVQEARCKNAARAEISVVGVGVPDIQKVRGMDMEVGDLEIQLPGAENVVNMVENIGYQFFRNNRFAALFLHFPSYIGNIQKLILVDIELTVVGEGVEDVHIERKLGGKEVEGLGEKPEIEGHVPVNFVKKKIDLVSRFVRIAAVEGAEGRSALYNLSLTVPAAL
jgi:hypothetical protein